MGAVPPELSAEHNPQQTPWLPCREAAGWGKGVWQPNEDAYGQVNFAGDPQGADAGEA